MTLIRYMCIVQPWQLYRRRKNVVPQKSLCVHCTPFTKILSARETQLKTQDDHVLPAPASTTKTIIMSVLRRAAVGVKHAQHKH